MTAKRLSRWMALGLALGACSASQDGTPTPAGTAPVAGMSGTPGTPSPAGINPPPGTQPPGTQPPGTQPPGTQPPGTQPPGTPGTPPPPFQALPPRVYAAKVKNLLTGLALTDEELRAVVARPAALPELIDTWIARPEWREKTLELFRHAFQQTQTDMNDYDEQLGRGTNPWNTQDRAHFVRSAEESFARTALALIDEGKPFTEVLTTDRIMLNPPLMSSYAYIDAVPQNDELREVRAAAWLLQKFPGYTFVRTLEPIPVSQSIDPTSPNFGKWHDPNPYMGMQPGCKEPQTRTALGALQSTGDILYGGRPGCGSTRSQWTAADWGAWRMVKVRRPRAGEERTIFWDLPRLRDPNNAELVLQTPRVGFMTTLAFFANWPTNESNSYRVTANQALIVALGRSFDDRGTTVQINETSLDNMHIAPGTACFGCHQTLDPMRDFFRQSFSLPYSTQLMNMGVPAMGTFTVDGSAPVVGRGIEVFARALAEHPHFAPAWTQKLCQVANSAPCVHDDPDFIAIADQFRKNKHNWKTLVRDLFSSPLVTFARETTTARTIGVVVGITRRETLCSSLDHRLGTVDVCNLRRLPAGLRAAADQNFLTTARNLAVSIPGEGYARGDEIPLLPHDPNLFFAAATENMCVLLGRQLIDRPMSRWASNKKDEAIRDFVATVMGLPPSDPRAAEMKTILDEHHAEAMKAGVGAAEALRSAFTLACQSPSATSLGL